MNNGVDSIILGFEVEDLLILKANEVNVQECIVLMIKIIIELKYIEKRLIIILYLYIRSDIIVSRNK